MTLPPGEPRGSERAWLLGVRADVRLTARQLHTLQVLAEYNLGPVRERLLRDGVLPSTWVDEAIFELRRYMALRLRAADRLPMLSQPVDLVWHTCLLFTRLYADWCQQAFGEFVHHEPATEPDPNPRATWRAFEESYVALYGSPPGRLWQMGQQPD